MAPIPKFIACTLLLGTFFTSCQKKFLCPDCETNKPPVANAGADQKITLPKDSVLLDGSTSIDSDGKIASYNWTKISGPVSSNIVSSNSSKTLVKILVMGVYEFQLSVTDNGGLTSKDTVQILVDNPAINQQPVACAGADQTITLPANTVTLDGSCSADPDNNITSYLWTTISGPMSFTIADTNAVRTQITNLVQGAYQFELKVTDVGGLYSKDTMEITVNPMVNSNSCGSSRPQVNAQLIPFGVLSEPRWWVTVASAGNKIVFAGGHKTDSYSGTSSRVDIYDMVTQSWSTAELSVPRYFMTSVAAGNNIFFAGGGYFDDGDNWHYYNRIDIYNASTNTWSVDSLSEPGIYSSATVGNKVFFTGRNNGVNVSNKVDIYDLSTNSWSTDVLSEARFGISAVTTNNKIYFAGGFNSSNTMSARIDIYDNASGKWSSSVLSEARAEIQSIAVADKVYWAGGIGSAYVNSCKVEIKDINTQTSSSAYLFRPASSWMAAGVNPVLKNNKIAVLRLWVNFQGGDGYSEKFDIYDIATKTWSIGLLPYTLPGASVISVNNTIYITGLGTSNIPNQVYKLEF